VTTFYSSAADFVLLLHMAIIAFNVGGLIIIPLGAWRRWRFVRVFWWRALHLASMCAVALQAALGRACFLTYWEATLAADAGKTPSTMPLVQRLLMDLIYLPLPLWAFALIYAAALAYCAALWRWIAPRARVPRRP
jgi:hypothetical protein